MATDCSLLFPLPYEDVTAAKFAEFCKWMVAEGFASMETDFRDGNKNTIPDVCERLLTSESERIYIWFATENNRLSDLVQELMDASFEASELDSEYSSACIYTTSFKRFEYEIEGGGTARICAFEFSGDGYLDADLIQQQLEKKPTFQSFARGVEHIFKVRPKLSYEMGW